MSDDYKDIGEIIYILNNIRAEDDEELTALFGLNGKKKITEELKDKKFKVLYGYNNDGKRVPVAMGGVTSVGENYPDAACVWLITSKYINRNKTGLVKILKREIDAGSKKYAIMYNFIYKSNVEIRSLLKKFGFRFDKPKPPGVSIPEGFEFFYKINERNGN